MAATISKQLIESARLHLLDGVDIFNLKLSRQDSDRIERVGYVLRLVAKHPDTDVFDTFKRMAAGRYASAMEDWHAAKKDKLLYDEMVRERAASPSCSEP